MIHVGILTVSLRTPRTVEGGASSGKGDPSRAGDPNGVEEPSLLRAVSACLPPDEFQILRRAQASSDEGEIAMQILALCNAGCDLVLTTGGVGFAPGDVTPEATVSVLDRNAPGIAELLRSDDSGRPLRSAALSRGVAGMHGQTLIVNLPTEPEAVRENLTRLVPLLPDAIALLHGDKRA